MISTAYLQDLYHEYKYNAAHDLYTKAEKEHYAARALLAYCYYQRSMGNQVWFTGETWKKQNS